MALDPCKLRQQKSIPKTNFSNYLASLKIQTYFDTNLSSNSKAREPHYLRTIAWNPLGSLVATGTLDKTLHVWNPEKPNVRFSTELKGHGAAVEKVAFNPTKDAELASISADGVVKIWDVRTKACVNEIKDLGQGYTLAWAPDGQSLIVGNCADTLYILSPTRSTPISSHQQPVQTNEIAFCWSGKKVYVTTGDGKIRILSYPDLQPVLHRPYPSGSGSSEFTLTGHASVCGFVALSPNGRRLATGGNDSIITLWDTTDWLCQRALTHLAGPVKSVSFSFDGSYIAGGCDKGSGLEIIHVESGESVYTFKTPGACEQVAWSPDKYRIAYSDLGGVLRIIGVEGDKGR